MSENLQTIETLDPTPFKHFITTIGALPTTFTDSMSYYELLAWFCDYLQNTVIPAINNNGEAVEELQTKFIELKTFVDEYFDNLDVQQEINNKLDQMAEDGTLTALIKGYVDPYINEQNARIDAQDNAISAQNNRISAVEGTVAGLSAGSPIFVSSTDEMTDEDAIYVLTTDGSIYYYDGTEFVDSGVDYGANILTFTGVTTSVSSTSVLDDFNNALPNRAYIVTATNIPNQPIEQGGTLITFRYNKVTTTNKNGMVQFYLTSDGDHIYKRIFWSSAWKTWKDIQISLSSLQNEAWVFTSKGTVSSTSDLADFDNAMYNKCYLVTATNIPNQPIAEQGTLITFRHSGTSSAQPNGFVQTFITKNQKIYTRYYYNNTWHNWIQIATSDMLPYASTSNYSSISVFQTIGVIGDSFASGWLGDAPEGHKNRYSISWPQIMARKGGFTALNLSSGGLSTRTWLTATRGLTLLNSSAAQNLYMIALGINDVSEITGGTETLGSIADIDLDNPDSNPNTFYGNYGKILSAIKTKSSDAKVILITIPKDNTGSNKTINDAIIEIGSTFELPVIVSHKNSVFTSNYFSNEKSTDGHPTVAGYGTMAEAYTTMANECIANYYDYFKDYLGSETV